MTPETEELLLVLVLAAAFVAVGYAMGRRRKNRRQRTFVWCPVCRTELIGTGAYERRAEDGTEIFTCKTCRTRSRWRFTPSPACLAYEPLQCACGVPVWDQLHARTPHPSKYMEAFRHDPVLPDGG